MSSVYTTIVVALVALGLSGCCQLDGGQQCSEDPAVLETDAGLELDSGLVAVEIDCEPTDELAIDLSDLCCSCQQTGVCDGRWVTGGDCPLCCR